MLNFRARYKNPDFLLERVKRDFWKFRGFLDDNIENNTAVSLKKQFTWFVEASSEFYTNVSKQAPSNFLQILPVSGLGYKLCSKHAFLASP